MTTLVVATGNPGKLKEMQAYLSDLGWELTLKPAELDVEETGATFAENACLKASQIAQATANWAIADDSGLEVAVLGGAPGVFSARYGDTDAARIARLLEELGDRSERSARFVCAIAIARPDGTIVLQAEGVCPGEILLTPRGTGGFGYDPIFFVPSEQRTFAEMTSEQKRRVSHRGQAIQALLPQLKTLRA
ncbi:MAG TPA: RdgB/HAM1 family non-canonical purine NTP pyrophosphatase [Thermosynechococcaceae cyanobacterium]